MSLHRHRSRSLGTGYRYARGVAVDRTVFPSNPHVDVMHWAMGHLGKSSRVNGVLEREP